MSRIQTLLAWISGILSAVALGMALANGTAPLLFQFFLVLSTVSLLRFRRPFPFWFDGLLMLIGAIGLLLTLPVYETAPAFFWLALVAWWGSPGFSWSGCRRPSEKSASPAGYLAS